MRRIKLYQILICLLCLFPVWSLAQSLTQYEYWIDDNFSARKSAGLSGYEADIDVAIDASRLGNGLHKLCLRVQQSDGMYSPITTHYFFKMQYSNGSLMEYWFDNDRKKVYTVEGHVSSDGEALVFNSDLDLSEVSPGCHRMYYRFVNADGTTSGAVSMTPIMVKSLYKIDTASKARVKKYAISIDEEEPVLVNLPITQDDITIPYTMDVRDLSEGPHIVKARFWNSVNTSVSVEQKFEVAAPEKPSLTLVAHEKDGLVQLQFNSLPNEERHRIIRVDGNGVRNKIYESLFGNYPNNDSYTDDPTAGDYTYYVQTKYEDFDGTTHTVKSNEVSISVTQSQAELANCGYIIGKITRNIASPKFITISFSDGVEVVSENGVFRREKIPANTELTITVLNNQNSAMSLSYEPITVTVKSGENFVNIKGITQEDLAPNSFEHDLVFDSDLEWIGPSFKFMVKNQTRKTWKGQVRFRAISEKTAEDEAEQSITSNYYLSEPQDVELASGKSTLVTLSLDNVFPEDKKDTYLFYIESVGKWATEKDDVVKPIAVNSDYNVTENPISRLIDKSSLAKAEDLVLMQNIEYAANLVLIVASKIKAFDGILGNMDEYCQELDKQTEKLGRLDGKKGNAYLEYVFKTETFEELLCDEMVQLVPKTALGGCGSAIIKKFRENIQSDILDEAWNEMSAKNVFVASKFINNYLGKAMKMLKYVNDYKDWQNMNTYDRHFYCARAIIKYGEKTNPLCKILNTYLDVAEAYINKALEYGEEYYGRYEAGFLYENIPSAEESNKFDYNKYIDFKIEVQTNKLVNFNFDPFLLGNGTRAIKEVKVMLSNRSEKEVDTIYFQPIGVLDGVMLKQTKYVGMDPYKTTLPQGNIEGGWKLKRLWMEIKWKNGRTSKIPLLNRENKTNGVELVISPTKPYQYIVRFKSGTTKYDHLADIIELKQ